MNRRANVAADDAQAQAPAQPAADSGDDNLAQLEKLGKLREDGVITDAEFEAKKQQLLGL